MRHLKVAYRPEAVDDLEEIFRYVLDKSQSLEIAYGFVRRIKGRCERVGNVPLGGRPRDDLEPGLRTVPFEKSAVIAYKVESDLVRITNVFYGGRDYDALYRDPPSAGEES
jgi:toxin ParE1/3/4